MNVLDLGFWYSLAAALPSLKWDNNSCKKVTSLLVFSPITLQEEDRIIDLVEWGWTRYTSDRIDRVFDSKMRVMKVVQQEKGSNFYEMPRSGRKKTENDLLPAIKYSTFSPHGLKVGDRIEVFLRDTSSPFGGDFYPGIVKKVAERWCTVEYDDGDVFSDYFDSTVGSQVFRKC